MNNNDKYKYTLNTHVILKKTHPCGGNEWEIIRLGADIKIKCCTCGRTVFIPRIEFNKRIKKMLEKEDSNEKEK